LSLSYFPGCEKSFNPTLGDGLRLNQVINEHRTRSHCFDLPLKPLLWPGTLSAPGAPIPALPASGILPVTAPIREATQDAIYDKTPEANTSSPSKRGQKALIKVELGSLLELDLNQEDMEEDFASQLEESVLGRHFFLSPHPPLAALPILEWIIPTKQQGVFSPMLSQPVVQDLD
jgi:hypothetical protein